MHSIAPLPSSQRATSSQVGAQKASWRATIHAHPYAAPAVAIAAVVAVAAGAIWWRHLFQYESTDDAFVDARTVAVSAQIVGAIIDLPVTDNQIVNADAVLVRIDPRDYEAAVAQAKAQVAQAGAAIANLDAQIDAQNARIEQAQEQVRQTQAAFEFAQEENARAQELFKTGVGTQQRAQQAASNLHQAEAAFAAAKANAKAAELQLAVLQTQRMEAVGRLEQARAVQSQAETNLSRTEIRAPVVSRVTKLSAAKGSYTQPGLALMMLVPPEVWVTANFKETQLNLMRVGQPVDIRIDAYPGRVFAGHVDSIQAGSGAAFSLLPPENATGNYVKVVQRVPVKIIFKNAPDVFVGPGMSVVPTVKVR
jgi:membrane fusion protein (multidrug efflux system)